MTMDAALIPGGIFLLGLVQALALVVLQGLRTDIRDLRGELRTGGERFRVNEAAQAELRERVALVERMCEVNHAQKSRAEDPAWVDPSQLRTRGGRRAE